MHKILVVDDEPDIVKILEILLAKSGFEGVSAIGGEKALEILHSGVNVDLAILDVKMPGIKGIDVLKAMKSMNREWPVIILSGSIDMKKHELETKDVGFQHVVYITKPVDLDMLLDAVRKALNPNPDGKNDKSG